LSWVSTNDVMTSFLIETGNYGRAYMAVDLRGEIRKDNSENGPNFLT